MRTNQSKSTNTRKIKSIIAPPSSSIHHSQSGQTSAFRLSNIFCFLTLDWREDAGVSDAWVSEGVSEWGDEWVRGWVRGWVSEVNEWMGEWVRGWVRGWVNGGVSEKGECVSKWIREQVSEWMGGCEPVKEGQSIEAWARVLKWLYSKRVSEQVRGDKVRKTPANS